MKFVSMHKLLRNLPLTKYKHKNIENSSLYYTRKETINIKNIII